MDAEDVEALVGQKVEEFGAMSHHPDDESVLIWIVRVYAGMTEVGGLAVFFEKEIDFWVGFSAGIDVACAGGEFTPWFCGCGVLGECGGGEYEEEEEVVGFAHLI